MQNTPENQSLVLQLYVRDWCGYCSRVERVINALGIDVPLRNTRDSEHMQALMAARGRRTVPVLRISQPHGSDIWLAESRDIIAFLEEQFGPHR